MPRGVNRKCNRCQHKRHCGPGCRLRKRAGRTARSKCRLATLAAECGRNVTALAALQQYNHDDEKTNNNVNRVNEADNHEFEVFRSENLVRKGGFEPPRLSAP